MTNVRVASLVRVTCLLVSRHTVSNREILEYSCATYSASILEKLLIVLSFINAFIYFVVICNVLVSKVEYELHNTQLVVNFVIVTVEMHS